jgi:acetoin utilization protein AcuB
MLMRLRDIMSVGVVSIGPRESTSAARASMRRHRVRHLVVVDGGRVVGIVSERDFGRSHGSASRDRTVEDVMTTGVVSATPETTLRQAANLMRGHTVGSLLVVEDDKLVGLVTTTDLLDQLGRGATRPTVRTEPPPVRRPPGTGRVRGTKSVRGPTGPRSGRRSVRSTAGREPLPSTLPRNLKLARDRTGEVPPPAHIRVIGAAFDAEDRDTIARKLGKQLGKFASSIERTTVRLSDANGPKGGRDQVVQVKVVLSGLPSVIVEERDQAYQRAVNRAIKRAALAVRNSVQRRRLKPRRRGATP